MKRTHSRQGILWVVEVTSSRRENCLRPEVFRELRERVALAFPGEVRRVFWEVMMVVGVGQNGGLSIEE